MLAIFLPEVTVNISESSQLRLAGTSRTSLLMGRPEIFFREWTMLCLVTNETAKVICRTLGFPSYVLWCHIIIIHQIYLTSSLL